MTTIAYDRCPRCKASVSAWIDINFDDPEGDENIKCRNCGAELILSWTCDISTCVRLDGAAEAPLVDPNQRALPL